MSLHDAKRLQSIFASALELPGPVRAEFLERECAGDPELLRELRGLLAADAQLEGTTARPVGIALTEMLESTAVQATLSGLRVGAFVLREELGRGGMGSVYRAERVDGTVDQQVAIKCVRRDVLGAETIKRFQLERQLLASLDHPNIARLLDAAELDDGTPYFVMEYVAGVPITDHCARAHLSVRDRVVLLREVCAAVAEAHRRLIVHRDLKPSNILVRGDGKPKLLDFGIAKALDGGVLVGEQTATAHRYFSPNYAAPEQLTGAETGVACDIYALGLLMYELLAGSRAFDFKELSVGQIERLIAQVPPVAPSVTAARGDDPGVASRARLLRGDLDGIVLRCLRKAPGERYASVEQLDADLANYLEGRPVQARGGHGWYRAQKFLSRNAAATAAGSLAVVALVGGLVAFAWQARIAEQKAAELEQVATFQAEMLAQVDPTQAGILLKKDVRDSIESGLTVAGTPAAERVAQLTQFDAQWLHVNPTDTARRLIDRTILQPAAAAIETQFNEQPLVAASLRDVLAERYLELGMDKAAIPLREQALAVRRNLLGEEHPLTLDSLSGLGLLMSTDEQYDKAERLLRDALEKERRVLGEEHPDTLNTLNNLGSMLSSLGKEEAEPLLRAAVASRRRVLGENDPRTATSIHNLGSYLQEQVRMDEAEPLLREALDKRLLLGDEVQTITSLNSFGMMMQFRGNRVEAERLYRESLRRSQRVYGELNINTYHAMQNLAQVFRDQARYEDAERLSLQALDTARKTFGPEHDDTRDAMNRVANVYLRRDKFEDAAPFAEDSLALHRRFGKAEDEDTLFAHVQWAEVLLHRERHAEVLALLEPTMAISRKVLTGRNENRMARVLIALGNAHTGLGDFAAAERQLAEATEIIGRGHTGAFMTRRSMQATVDLYRARHRAAPEDGHDARVALWQQKLDELIANSPAAGGKP